MGMREMPDQSMGLPSCLQSFVNQVGTATLEMRQRTQAQINALRPQEP